VNTDPSGGAFTETSVWVLYFVPNVYLGVRQAFIAAGVWVGTVSRADWVTVIRVVVRTLVAV